MGRNTAGTYSLPLADRVPGTTITSTWANTSLTDIASGITESLSRSGNGGMLSQLKSIDGTQAAPGLSFTDELGTGFWRSGTNTMRAVANATTMQQWSSTAVSIPLALSAGSTLAVTGAATLSSTLAVTGDLTVDTSTLKVDATNNRVGIGTASPGCVLAVGHAGVTNSKVPVQINAGANDEAYYAANKGGSFGLLMGYSNNGVFGTRAVIRNAQNENLGLYVNDTTHVLDLTSTGVQVKTSNPSSSTAFTNTLTPTNVPKAWADMTTNGAGGVTVNAGFNITSAAIAGAAITIVLASAMTSTNYAPMPLVSTSGGYIGRAAPISTTQFSVQVYSVPAAGDLDLSSNVVRIFLVVFGAQ